MYFECVTVSESVTSFSFGVKELGTVRICVQFTHERFICNRNLYWMEVHSNSSMETTR